MTKDKTFELIYSTQHTDYIEGRAYSNPRFFSSPRSGVTKVLIVGDWPNIVEAHTLMMSHGWGFSSFNVAFPDANSQDLVDTYVGELGDHSTLWTNLWARIYLFFHIQYTK